MQTQSSSATDCLPPHAVSLSPLARATASKILRLMMECAPEKEVGVPHATRIFPPKFATKVLHFVVENTEYARREALITNKEAKRLTRKYFH